jgi:hypothetical protein
MNNQAADLDQADEEILIREISDEDIEGVGMNKPMVSIPGTYLGMACSTMYCCWSP